MEKENRNNTNIEELMVTNLGIHYSYITGFMRNVNRYSNQMAAFDIASRKEYTYYELNQNVNQLASHFIIDNVEKSDVVMFALYNSIEFIYSFLAAQKIGAISCPINYNMSSKEIAYMIDDSVPKVFIYNKEFDEKINIALNMCNHRPSVILSDSDLVEYMSKQSDNNPILSYTLDSFSENTRLYTSGTTGLPKGVPLSSLTDTLSAHDVIMNYPLNNTDKTLNLTPWFHRGGLHSGLIPTLYVGGCVFILRECKARTVLKIIPKYKITFIMGVPAILSLLAYAQEHQQSDLTSLKGIITMGSPLEKNACLYFKEILSPNIFNGYGTTETFWNTFLKPEDLPEKAGTIGRSITDDDVRVIYSSENHTDPNKLVPTDNRTVGEIVICSPGKMSYRYHNNKSSTDEKYSNGFFYTGDLATWDENHFITICGRKDDMIISSGENIYPSQIEEVLNQHPLVEDSIVTSISDELRGEVIVAYILPSNKTLTISILQDYCEKHPYLSKYKIPRYYKLVDSLPYTATGKKKHNEIRLLAKQEFSQKKW